MKVFRADSLFAFAEVFFIPSISFHKFSAQMLGAVCKLSFLLRQTEVRHLSDGKNVINLLIKLNLCVCVAVLDATDQLNDGFGKTFSKLFLFAVFVLSPFLFLISSLYCCDFVFNFIVYVLVFKCLHQAIRQKIIIRSLMPNTRRAVYIRNICWAIKCEKLLAFCI